MIRMWRVYRALIRREIRLVMAYRAQMVIWLITGVLPLIMLSAWLTLGEGGPVGSFTPTDFIAYYLAVFLACAYWLRNHQVALVVVLMFHEVGRSPWLHLA